MENFFSTGNSSENKSNKTPINNQYESLKENYERIFIESAESIRAEIDKFKPENPCTLCNVKCDIEKKDIFTVYPSGCKYIDWQHQVITFLTGDYKQKLKNTYRAMMDKKNNYECNCCGDCCRLAVSEYSYQQLKQRAARGDKYSSEFISIYVPFESEEKARAANPDYFDALIELMGDSKIYYYHCTKQSGNLCSDYENRPDICKDFPYNPLKLLPPKCSFNAWKDEVDYTAKMLKAKTDIIEFYKSRLK